MEGTHRWKGVGTIFLRKPRAPKTVGNRWGAALEVALVGQFSAPAPQPQLAEIGHAKHLLGSLNWNASPMADTIIRQVARALSPDRPVMFLAGLAKCPRSTAKSWCTGHRRPPIWLLDAIRSIADGQDLTGLAQALNHLIRQRKDEPKQRTGFHLIRERDGPGSTPRDGRNRRGRPKRIKSLRP